ncbi:MFS transporter [Algoriphagus kandeliae]|uniref:MFS transporter n=1 Tax=Algoriphagus kandeliae TaxID=2562278 RepID=A0A4Y9QPS4_9BACT|nr:MFS transporter [Algoriphagus kandeliae]TFV94609.1 MFS transporter [Algoriphagus kandeliae]
MNFLLKRRIAIGSMFFFLGLCFASWAARIPDIQTKFDLSEGQLGSILLFLPIGSIIGLPIAGWSVHHYGSKKVILWGSFAYALSLPLIGLSPSLWMLVLVLMTFGLLGNIMNIALNTQALDFEDEYGKSILAFFHGLWSMAGFVGAGIGAVMIGLGWVPFSHYLVVAGISIGIILTSKAFIFEEKSRSEAGGLVLKKPDELLLRVGLISFLGMMTEGCMFDWSGVYFKKVVEAPAEWVTLGYVAFMGTMASGRFISDRFIQRFGKVPILRVSGILIFTGLSISVLVPTIVWATIGFLMVGFGVASIVPVSYSVAGRSTLYSPGIALALVSTISFFGFLIGPPLIGFIADLFSLKTSFALIAVNGLGIALLSTVRKQVFFPTQTSEKS